MSFIVRGLIAMAVLCPPSLAGAEGDSNARSDRRPVPKIERLTFLGEVTFPTGFQFQGTEVGGLSGLDFDPYSQTFYALADDRSATGPARFYTLDIDLTDGSLDAGDIQFRTVVTLKNQAGQPFPLNGVDPEAIRFDPFRGTLFWTSEGDANALQAPFVREMEVDGSFIRELQVPAGYLPTADQRRGIRNNLAFESLTFSFNRRQLVTATENALFQDGDPATLTAGSRARILQINARTGRAGREFIYVTEPIAAPPVPAGSFATNGLVEMLAVGFNQYLAVERSFSVGVGNAIKLFRVDTSRATDVSKRRRRRRHVQPAAKDLLLDLSVLGITLDNIEGLTFGPRLPTGELTLILVSDNNFNPNGQFTQFLAFAIDR